MRILLETKTHLIKKLPNLSNEEKQAVIDLFIKRPDLESKINWNDKTLTIDAFKPYFNNESKNEKFKKIKNGDLAKMFDGYNCKIYKVTPSQIWVIPMDYECCVFMDSFKCYGTGAKWCIGDSNYREAYDRYVSYYNYRFCLYYNNETREKFMLQFGDPSEPLVVWDAEDDQIDASLETTGMTQEELDTLDLKLLHVNSCKEYEPLDFIENYMENDGIDYPDPDDDEYYEDEDTPLG
jgi:hypothetical protein